MVRPVARFSRAAALPQSVLPQLTQLVDAAPEGDQWLHEIKFDGYRMHARLDRGDVRLMARTGLDWTHKLPADRRGRLGARGAPSRDVVDRKRTISELLYRVNVAFDGCGGSKERSDATQPSLVGYRGPRVQPTCAFPSAPG
jgi:hypothetical protein